MAQFARSDYSAKQMDEQSKAAGFYQEALDHVARQGYGNASFEVGGEEGLDIVEEFYTMNLKQSISKRMI
jgi:hypothetical protein